MNVLGQVKVSWVIHFNAILGLGTLLLCYSLAMGYGHVSLWPVPMISDCAVYSPEKFPFRLGIVTTALLMSLISILVFLSGASRSKVALVLGVVGPLLLAVVGVVNEKEASKVHSGNGSKQQPHPHNYVIHCFQFLLSSSSYSTGFIWYWSRITPLGSFFPAMIHLSLCLPGLQSWWCPGRHLPFSVGLRSFLQ